MKADLHNQDLAGDRIIPSFNHRKILTKEELLFLHLLNYNDQRNNYVVSEFITEKGIQSILDCDLGLVSRILSKNEKKGYIYRELLKIENKKRKQNAFFLTEEGVRIALELTKLRPNSSIQLQK